MSRKKDTLAILFADIAKSTSHFGPVIRERQDVFGDAVNVAARMATQAYQRQIFTTNETVN